MGEITATENGDTIFTSDEKDDFISSIRAAQAAGGEVTILTDGRAKYAARIRYPEGTEIPEPEEDAPVAPDPKKATKPKKDEAPADDIIGDAPAEEAPAQS